MKLQTFKVAIVPREDIGLGLKMRIEAETPEFRELNGSGDIYNASMLAELFGEEPPATDTDAEQWEKLQRWCTNAGAAYFRLI